MKTYSEPLYLAGFNIDPDDAYYGTRTKKLERVAPGAFLRADLDVEERRTVLTRNAARIATMGYTGTALTGSSAFHRGAVEGHLMLTSPNGGKPVDVGGAFTIYFTRNSEFDVGLNHELELVSIEDDFGPYAVKRVCDELLILKNFQVIRGRPRTTYLNVKDLADVVERCIAKYHTRDALLDKLKSLAVHFKIDHYYKDVCKFIEGVGHYTQAPKNLTEYLVYWHDEHVATLASDGHVWSWDYEKNVALQLSLSERKGRRSPPSFLASLLPEIGRTAGGTVEERLESFANAPRYLSNITVHSAANQSPELMVDVLEARLRQFSGPSLQFTGRIDPSLSEVAGNEGLMTEAQDSVGQPRLSGMQAKLAVNLNSAGVLSAADGKSFTHILKVPGTASAYSTFGSMEWYSMAIAKMCQLNVEEFALVDLPDMGPGLLVERFDVRTDFNDRRRLLTEDFWSVFGMQVGQQKYRGELLDVADAIIKYSTDPAADGRQLVMQSAFSWLTFNGDMHLKNLMFLKEAYDTSEGFTSVRLSPAYDMICTQVYPKDAVSSAISLCGSRQHTLAGFRKLGKKFGIEADEVDAIVESIAIGVPMWARRIANALPASITNHQLSMEHIERAQALFDVRCMMMVAELDAAKTPAAGAATHADDDGSFDADATASELDVDAHIQAERSRSFLSESRVSEAQAGAPQAEAVAQRAASVGRGTAASSPSTKTPATVADGISPGSRIGRRLRRP